MGMTMKITIRNPREEDYPGVASALESWWDLPELQTPIHRGFRLGAVPRLYFQHFNSSCLLAEYESQDELAGFLVGFQSQDHPEEAYIHFFGVNPKARRQGIGSRHPPVQRTNCSRSRSGLVSQAVSPSSQGRHRHSPQR